MAAGNQLKAVITGDISDLKAKLSQADGLLNQYRGNISRVQSAIGQNTQKSRQYEAQLQKLNQELKQGSISQEQFAKESDQLQNALLKTNRKTRDFQRELDRLQKETTQLENGMENLTASTTDYARSTQRMGRSTRQMTGQVNTFGNTTRGNAVPAMQSFSQIIQDAPYGINGVANNIQQLTAQFGYLSTQSGGAKNAFKAMLATLTGPAGILLAVSAITTLVQAFASGNIKMSDVLRTLAFESNDAAKALRELNESYRDGAADARVQITEIEALIGILQSETSTREEQIRAYNKLNDIQPSLLEGLTLQEAATEDLTDDVNLLSEALLRQAKISGFKDVLSEKYKEIARLAQEAGVDTASFTDYLQALLNTANVASGGFAGTLQFEGTKTALEDIASLKKEAENLSTTISTLIGEDIKLGGLYADDSETEKARTEIENKLNKQPIRAKVEPVSTLTPSGIIQPETSDISPISTEIKIEDNTDWEKLYENMERAQETAKIFSDATTASFSALAGGIAESLQTGNRVLDAFVSSLIQSLGKMVAELATNAIETIAINQAKSTSGAITAASQTAASTPFGAFALPALIAGAVAAISGAFSNIGSFAGGGIVGGGSFNGDKIPAFVNSGEMILNMGQQRELFNLLDGRMGSLQGSAQSLKIQVEGVTRGEDIYWSQQRYTNNRSRRG